MKKIDSRLSINNLKDEWSKRRAKMLEEKIDYSNFLTCFVENYTCNKNKNQ